MVLGWLLLAVPIGLSPLHILAHNELERVLVCVNGFLGCFVLFNYSVLETGCCLFYLQGASREEHSKCWICQL